MALPDVGTVVKPIALVIPLIEPDETSATDDNAKSIVFVLRPIGAEEWDRVVIRHGGAYDPRTGSGATFEAMAPELFDLGIASCAVVEHANAKLAADGGELDDVLEAWTPGHYDAEAGEYVAGDGHQMWAGEWPGFIGNKLLEAIRRFYETGSLTSPFVPRSTT